MLGCGGGGAVGGAGASSTAAWEPEGRVIPLTLAGGQRLEVELRQTPDEQSRGMMFRPQLPPDKGMLFVFERQQPRPFWMFQTMVALDMIWLDDNKRVVEIHENAPPCGQRDFRNCPTYGGNQQSTYVLELAAGRAAAYGVQVGDQVEF